MTALGQPASLMTAAAAATPRTNHDGGLNTVTMSSDRYLVDMLLCLHSVELADFHKKNIINTSSLLVVLETGMCIL